MFHMHSVLQGYLVSHGHSDRNITVSIFTFYLAFGHYTFIVVTTNGAVKH